MCVLCFTVFTTCPWPLSTPLLPTCHAIAIDAILGLYSDAQMECAARLLPEDRLGEVRVEQMVRKGFAGHCMVQVRKCSRGEGWGVGGREGM